MGREGGREGGQPGTTMGFNPFQRIQARGQGSGLEPNWRHEIIIIKLTTNDRKVVWNPWTLNGATMGAISIQTGQSMGSIAKAWIQFSPQDFYSPGYMEFVWVSDKKILMQLSINLIHIQNQFTQQTLSSTHVNYTSSRFDNNNNNNKSHLLHLTF